MSFKIILIWEIITIFFFPQFSCSDVAVLTNGKKITANKIWQENGKVVCSINGNTLTLNSEDVSKIIKKTDRVKTKNGGFHFDVWESAMDIEEIISTARFHDIPLHKNGIISINKKFNPLVSSKYAKTATHYYYKTKLLGKYARVDLFLTPSSKKLHTLSINWHGMANKNNRSGFEKEITEMLSQKYGSPKNHTRQIFGKTKTWTPSNRTKIDLEMTSGNYILVYKDNALMQLNQTEKKQIRSEEKMQYQSVDSSKL
jgi:hypothetical protein